MDYGETVESLYWAYERLCSGKGKGNLQSFFWRYENLLRAGEIVAYDPLFAAVSKYVDSTTVYVKPEYLPKLSFKQVSECILAHVRQLTVLGVRLYSEATCSCDA